jgi:tRNA G10  N-methylase Trm11
MRYFFILGSNPTLSLAELAAVFNHGRFSLIQKNIAILEVDYEIKANLIKKIGGVIKFGLIHNELNSLVAKDILKAISIFGQPEKIETKFNFGISFYGKSKINLKVLGMEFKKLLKQSSINSRWVISREPTLSSVVVEQNKLVTDRGVEIVMIEFNKKLFLGKTLAVQPFKELSFRDYGRPARDDYSGMLPPKLAQIMINLSGADTDKTILDPFCGSGTIITEAMLMGYDRIIGSDISNKAITNTKTNIEWIEKNYKIQNTKCKILNSDAMQISEQIQPNSIDAIITEPYLGPQRGGFEIYKIIKELESLYSKSLLEFKKILKPNGKIIIIWPVFQKIPLSLRESSSDRGNLTNTGITGSLNPDIAGFKIINPVPENLQKNIFIKLTARNTIVYGREGQKVWREIVMLEKLN